MVDTRVTSLDSQGCIGRLYSTLAAHLGLAISAAWAGRDGNRSDSLGDSQRGRSPPSAGLGVEVPPPGAGRGRDLFQPGAMPVAALFSYNHPPPHPPLRGGLPALAGRFLPRSHDRIRTSPRQPPGYIFLNVLPQAHF